MAEWSKAPDSSSGLRKGAWVRTPLLTIQFYSFVNIIIYHFWFFARMALILKRFYLRELHRNYLSGYCNIKDLLCGSLASLQVKRKKFNSRTKRVWSFSIATSEKNISRKKI